MTRVRIGSTWDENPRRPVEMPELCKMLGIKKRTVWQWIKKGLLPEPVRLPNKTFWLLREVDEVLAQAREPGKFQTRKLPRTPRRPFKGRPPTGVA